MESVILQVPTAQIESRLILKQMKNISGCCTGTELASFCRLNLFKSSSKTHFCIYMFAAIRVRLFLQNILIHGAMWAELHTL